MEKKTIDAWITKYALTQGILKVRAELIVGESMIKVKATDPSYFDAYYHGKDWHRSWEEAVSRAEQMRIDKITSLKKQLAKLEKMAIAVEV